LADSQNPTLEWHGFRFLALNPEVSSWNPIHIKILDIGESEPSILNIAERLSSRYILGRARRQPHNMTIVPWLESEPRKTRVRTCGSAPFLRLKPRTVWLDPDKGRCICIVSATRLRHRQKRG
jgi:hypothetical protein